MADPLPSLLDRTSVVLVEPKEALNIGSALRAGYNMGVRDIRLVTPCADDPARVAITAPGLADVAAALPRYASAREATADGALAIGFTARVRKHRRELWTLEQLIDRLPAALEGHSGRVHLVFGREDFGLPNEVLDMCDAYVSIQTEADYSSLNLAQAVLLGCHALRRTALDLGEVGQHHPARVVQQGLHQRVPGLVVSVEPMQHPATGEPLAGRAALDGLMDDAVVALEAIEFFKYEGARAAMTRTLRGIFSRARLDEREARTLRGMFNEVVGFIARRPSRSPAPSGAETEDAPPR